MAKPKEKVYCDACRPLVTEEVKKLANMWDASARFRIEEAGERELSHLVSLHKEEKEEEEWKSFAEGLESFAEALEQRPTRLFANTILGILLFIIICGMAKYLEGCF